MSFNPDNLAVTPERFIHAYAKMMGNWGMPLTAGRVMAYLFLQSKPANLDQVAADLGISKASAWSAARHLEQVGQIERFAEAGSKRALFAPIDDFSRSMRNYSNLLSKMGVLMKDAASGAAQDEAASRLDKRSGWYLAVHEAIEKTVAGLLTGQAERLTR